MRLILLIICLMPILCRSKKTLEEDSTELERQSYSPINRHDDENTRRSFWSFIKRFGKSPKKAILPKKPTRPKTPKIPKRPKTTPKRNKPTPNPHKKTKKPRKERDFFSEEEPYEAQEYESENGDEVIVENETWDDGTVEYEDITYADVRLNLPEKEKKRKQQDGRVCMWNADQEYCVEGKGLSEKRKVHRNKHFE